MTSFMIKAHVDRPRQPWLKDGSCAFCNIVRNELPGYRVYENDKVLAILDIMPLRKGHTLVIPKEHYARVSELPPELAAAIGEAVSKVANALTKAMNNTALNIVCNQEYAQAVPHVHYHIIPAPTFDKPTPKASTPEQPTRKDNSSASSPPLSIRRMHQLEFESRGDLDDDDATDLVKKLSARL
ncbi:hypothetical protein AX16_005366 [Volvariella volvacea WC 439]|nr:hypothetical protein AX16_005366 [Volvariella volvacea WC 439]